MPDINISQIQKFKDLTVYRNGPKSFRYAGKTQFNRFHQAIRRGVKAYIKELSTAFLNLNDILLQQATYERFPETSWFMINMLGDEAGCVNQMKYRPLLVMEGMSYNWTGKNPILHLSCQDLFP